MIYHITQKKAWEHALAQGFYETASLAKEGFIHNSTFPQVAAVLDRYYKNETNLVLLHIDETKLSSPLKFELAPSVNELFPHIFGPINLEAVVNVVPINEAVPK
jgi:uncharacterized protein (DUF952 family)